MKEKIKINTLIAIICTILFFICQFMIVYLSRNFSMIDLPFTTIESGRICSLFTLLQIMFTLILVITYKQKGYYLSLFLYLFGCIITGMPIIKEHSFNSIPGIFMYIAGSIIITIIYNYVKQLHYIANTDSLTNLPNRRALIENIENRINHHTRFAFVLIDLDNFKNINDTLGHENGDKVLKEITNRWVSFPHADNAIFSRIGGDEFVLVFNTTQSKEELEEHLRKNLVSNNQSRYFSISDNNFFVSASAGVSIFPDDADNFHTLYSYADIAMYQIKKFGKQNVCSFKPKYLQSINQEYQTEMDVRKAIKEDRIFVLFQPQFSIDDKTLHGAEALVRMKTTDNQIVSPVTFIPIAEQTNLIIQIDLLVLEKSLYTFKPYLTIMPNLILSVNMSVKTLFSTGFIEKVKQLLEKVDYPAINLQIEVTESLMITQQNKDNARNLLNELNHLGIKLALDDFGTGYSSLSYLKDFPFNTLKIDKSFIDGLSLSAEQDNNFVAAIISLGHLLHFNVISEGVEEEEQLKILQNLNCDIIQGYIWGKPMESSSLEKLLDI